MLIHTVNRSHWCDSSEGSCKASSDFEMQNEVDTPARPVAEHLQNTDAASSEELPSHEVVQAWLPLRKRTWEAHHGKGPSNTYETWFKAQMDSLRPEIASSVKSLIQNMDGVPRDGQEPLLKLLVQWQVSIPTIRQKLGTTHLSKTLVELLIEISKSLNLESTLFELHRVREYRLGRQQSRALSDKLFTITDVNMLRDHLYNP